MAKSFQVDTNGTLTTSLVSYYKLEDATDYWDSNALTNNGPVTFGSAKVNNGGTNFNGTNTYYLRNTAATGLPTGSGAWSINAWVYLTNSGSHNFCSVDVGSGTSTGGRLMMYCLYTNTHFYFSGQSADVDSGISVSTGTWTMITATFDGTTLRTYVNGTAGSTGTPSLNVSGSTVVIGCNSSISSSESWNGGVDEVGIWTKALSTTEVSDLYNGGSGQTMISGGTTYARAASLSMMNNASRYATAQRVWQTARTATVTMMNAAARAASAVFHLPAHYARTASVTMMNAASRYATVVSRITVVWVRTASVTMMNAASRLASATRSFIIKIGSTIRWDFWTWD